ncbi:MAG: hypothetical protein IPM91_21305 [Bacteroidetes bacterium]|nr:hypothetical protein [Bacteroidota bacterium]
MFLNCMVPALIPVLPGYQTSIIPNAAHCPEASIAKINSSVSITHIYTMVLLK